MSLAEELARHLEENTPENKWPEPTTYEWPMSEAKVVVALFKGHAAELRAALKRARQ
jgi:hypothetical protein